MQLSVMVPISSQAAFEDSKSFGLLQNKAGNVLYRQFEVLPLGDAHG